MLPARRGPLELRESDVWLKPTYLVEDSLAPPDTFVAWIRCCLGCPSGSRCRPLFPSAVQVYQHRPLTQVTIFVLHALIHVLSESLANAVPVDANVGVAADGCPT